MEAIYQISDQPINQPTNKPTNQPTDQTPRHKASRDQRIAAHKRPTPRKTCGRARKLSEEQLDEIIDFISSSKETRRLPYNQVIQELQLSISVETLRRALAKRGYHRCNALRKHPLSDRTRALRLNWALEHVNWTYEQWKMILWTDETWATSIYHRRIYVTPRSGEEFDDTCVRARVSCAPGWMFWGSFIGDEKGPCLFWEKE
ncbi:transposable element tc1 transposase [Penicillium argentinense]|uniref:Transposable element tc1 transposase n=1 Tax=Penicillium argentinense TaxID=1131581 RepID=A0A9W9F877_9EURO|nr:transposable element tc1 transposase [Penicillium argentinense]KAJ5095272.1 transposable element tc1 transposase [Penicillium argentinense]